MDPKGLTGPMRLFLGVGVPEISLEGVRIGSPEAPAHLTAVFLGEVAAERVPAMTHRFAAALAPLPAFALELAGIGVFPSAARPRVIWIGVRTGATELAEIHRAIVGACHELAWAVEDRPFVPHLTLRRVRGPKDTQRARRWLEEYPTKEFGRARVAEVELKESFLGGGPVVHRTIARFPLAGASAGV
ncbi:MAG: RNA 2',3'-cyclic phosphodiesterase [Thermoplasmata archaeon]|nr:RNA 2',3'-cyclic phosphodiesterase [Thermoplasmata archaeon]